MTIDRRRFLQAAGAAGALVPVLHAAPALGTAVPEAAAPAASAVAAPTAAPRAWSWWASLDGGERYVERFATREEARDWVAASGGGSIVEALPGTATWDCLGWDTLAQAFEDRHEDDADPEGNGVFDDVTKEDWMDLEERLKPVMARWWAERGIASKTHVYIFDAVRGQEDVGSSVSERRTA